MDAKIDPSTSDPNSANPPSAESTPPTDAFGEARRQFAELKEYASYFIAAKIDGIKASIRNAGLYAALAVIGLIAAATLVVTSVVLVCVGLAELIADAFTPPKPWVGNLAIGLVFLGLIGGGAWLVMSRIMKTSRNRIIEKYEDRKRRQRTSFGEDVRSRANGHGAASNE